MAVPHLILSFKGFSYFASGLKSVGSGQDPDGGRGGEVLELSVWSQEGTTDWDKDQTRGRRGTVI